MPEAQWQRDHRIVCWLGWQNCHPAARGNYVKNGEIRVEHNKLKAEQLRELVDKMWKEADPKPIVVLWDKEEAPWVAD